MQQTAIDDQLELEIISSPWHDGYHDNFRGSTKTRDWPWISLLESNKEARSVLQARRGAVPVVPRIINLDHPGSHSDPHTPHAGTTASSPTLPYMDETFHQRAQRKRAGTQNRGQEVLCTSDDSPARYHPHWTGPPDYDVIVSFL